MHRYIILIYMYTSFICDLYVFMCMYIVIMYVYTVYVRNASAIMVLQDDDYAQVHIRIGVHVHVCMYVCPCLGCLRICLRVLV